MTCAYLRERKKRGKASRKELAQQQATAAASSDRETQAGDNSTIATPQSQEAVSERAQNASPTLSEDQSSFTTPFVPSRSASLAATRLKKPVQIYTGRTMSMSAIDSVTGDGMQAARDGLQPRQPSRIHPQGLPHHEYAPMHGFQQSMSYESPHAMIQPTLHPPVPSNGDALEYGGHPRSLSWRSLYLTTRRVWTLQLIRPCLGRRLGCFLPRLLRCTRVELALNLRSSFGTLCWNPWFPTSQILCLFPWPAIY